jgi:hypothetical protein
MKDALLHMIENKETSDNFDISNDGKLNGADLDRLNNKIKNILKKGPP